MRDAWIFKKEKSSGWTLTTSDFRKGELPVAALSLFFTKAPAKWEPLYKILINPKLY
jgi:hypothetical protein